jgi:glycosyltransferase involved in cell wall biosynthesis
MDPSVAKKGDALMAAAPKRDQTRISVCIVCRNEADKLEPALQSLQWADEILLLDLASTDGSAELAERYGARVVHREPVPIVEMVRNEIAAEARNDWILALDPDERVSPGLAAELGRVAANPSVDAVVIPRMNYDFGYPPSSPWQRYEPQLRMYRRSRVTWPTIPNALPTVLEERLHRVERRDDLVLVHDRSRNIPEVLERSIRYAPLQAQSMIDRGQTFSARTMIGALSEQVGRHFLKSKALRDGVPGVLRASVLVLFHFYVWAAFWQLSGGTRTREDDRYLRRIASVLEGIRLSGRTVTLPLRLGRHLLKRARKRQGAG